MDFLFNKSKPAASDSLYLQIGIFSNWGACGITSTLTSIIQGIHLWSALIVVGFKM